VSYNLFVCLFLFFLRHFSQKWALGLETRATGNQSPRFVEVPSLDFLVIFLSVYCEAGLSSGHLLGELTTLRAPVSVLYATCVPFELEASLYRYHSYLSLEIPEFLLTLVNCYIYCITYFVVPYDHVFYGVPRL